MVLVVVFCFSGRVPTGLFAFGCSHNGAKGGPICQVSVPTSFLLSGDVTIRCLQTAKFVDRVLASWRSKGNRNHTVL
eukprot:536046-Amphidinium_carterae.2